MPGGPRGRSRRRRSCRSSTSSIIRCTFPRCGASTNGRLVHGRRRRRLGHRLLHRLLPHAARAARPSVPRESWRDWWRRWKPVWRVKTSGSAYRVNFDIHRAFGLWTWGLLFIRAFTGFSLNLYREIFFPLMSLVSQATPTPFELREAAAQGHLHGAILGFARQSHARRTAAGASLLRRAGWPAAGRSRAVEGDGRGYLRAGPVPASLRTDPGPARAHPHVGHWSRGCSAVRHRRRDLASQAPRTTGGREGACRRPTVFAYSFLIEHCSHSR